MRLIDADELLKQNDMMFSVREPNNWFVDPDEENYTNYYIEVNDINFWADENKVDAIPIKDLKKMKKLADKHWYRYCATSWDFGELIDEIIELWRKENESNISD